MRKNIDKKKAPIICAVAVIALMLCYLAVVLYGIIVDAEGQALAIGFLVIYGAVILAVIVGVVLALRQRLREIEGGEEEDAKKY